MTPRLTLKAQIKWAQGRAVQHRRLAARERPGSPAEAHALRHAAMADAIARSLSNLQPGEVR